ncbi:hypothetical protein CHLNCDRAFT_139886 [Chlorella variabilis]|uniref:Rho termination factor-like N-terminal domain-containing protein n=1 Tax=Chlorella variabilis TaxID=554065 RepID=E1ZR47_CHLVA|nr:hypothetical protein CHLNCDRAFT_139886 [Chlorella variabilis]EFN51719.1 hypothetical protein CHLNCDRAFT_139886 [Chlorella variabilis]|eukprot:XP_005843821.1 hypothetical protein CHLNCDRAFT_139886 [Chlorella variabilis]
MWSAWSRDNTQQRLGEASLVRQLCLTAAGAAAIGATAVALQRLQQQQPRQRERDGGAAGGGAGGGSGLPATPSAVQPLFGLGWPNREQQLQKTLHEIEKQQHKEAVKQLRRWDERFSLRTKPLAELRALAQKHNIPGRSRMRKPELVAALEAKLGWVQRRQPPPAAQ